MKHSILLVRLTAIHVLWTLTFAGAFTAQIAFGQGTAFTYQGWLTDGGNPANGTYDLRLSIYSAPAGGTLLAGPATNSPTTARDGLFSVQLDFGSGIFTGPERWLEIAVRTNGGGAFVLLTSRQQISTAPYAMTAREVTGEVAAEQLIGTIRSANIGAGTIHSNHLASGAIHSNHLALAIIHSNHVAIGGIHSNHLALGSIHSNHLALGSIHSNHLALASIHSNHLAVGIIHSNALALGSVTAAALANGSIHSNHLAVGSVHSNALAIGGIHSNHLAVGSIHSNHLGLATIHSNHLAVGSIHSNHLAVASIHSNHLAVASIHSNHLAARSIHSNALAIGSIHSNHLAVGSVHSNALALGSVTASALVNGSIHSNHLAAESVHSNTLVLGSIHSNHLAIGAIHSNHLAAGSVHSNALALGSVTADALASGSIHSNHLAIGSVHSNALAIGSIHSNHLVVGSIHSNHLAAGSVHSNALALNSVTASALAVGSIHSNHLTAGAVSLNNLNTAVSSSSALALSNPAPAFFTYFGTAVAAVGADKVLIGAYQDSSGADNGGAAYLVNTNGALVRTFLSPSPQNQEHFGFSVAALGQDRVLIGADGNFTGGIDAGAAYLFGTNGTLLTALTNPTPAASDFFGYAVTTVGADKLLIGAYGDHFGSNVGGAAYLFATNAMLLTTFTNPTPASGPGIDTAGGDRFSIAVAAVGADYVLIGADRDNQGAIDAGVAYLFHVTGTLVTTITNPTPAMSDGFGSAVAAVGPDRILIGAPADNSNGNAGGAAYLFDTSGALLTTFTNPTPFSGDQFGIAVAAMGQDKLLITAASDDNGATDAGITYLFSTNGTLLTTFNNPMPATSASALLLPRRLCIFRDTIHNCACRTRSSAIIGTFTASSTPPRQTATCYSFRGRAGCSASFASPMAITSPARTFGSRLASLL